MNDNSNGFGQANQPNSSQIDATHSNQNNDEQWRQAIDPDSDSLPPQSSCHLPSPEPNTKTKLMTREPSLPPSQMPV